MVSEANLVHYSCIVGIVKGKSRLLEADALTRLDSSFGVHHPDLGEAAASDIISEKVGIVVPNLLPLTVLALHPLDGCLNEGCPLVADILGPLRHAAQWLLPIVRPHAVVGVQGILPHRLQVACRGVEGTRPLVTGGRDIDGV